MKERSFEYYDDLFSIELFNKPKENEEKPRNIDYENNKEQNHIISGESNTYSLEEDAEAGSFAEAAEESEGGGGDDGFGGGGDDGFGGESDSSDDGFGGGDDGGDGFGGDEGGDGAGDDGNGESESSDKVDVLDSNRSSTLNPFTQINQKLYLLETLNGLRSSIQNSIDLYNAQYAGWSEVKQLKELVDILDDERRSFIMQQNPENMIKLGLYREQYDRLVQNISKKISNLAVNDKQ